MSERFRETFRDEALEILLELEQALLELEARPEDPGAIGQVFRSLHTIKGAAGMAGFDEISAFTHEVESIFELVRSGRMSVSRDLISLTLATRDQLKTMVDAHFGGAEAAAEKGQRIVDQLRSLLPAKAEAREDFLPPQPAPPGEESVYRVRFRPAPEIFHRGINPLALLRELATLGDCRVVAHLDEIPALEDLDPEQCHLYWDVILTTRENLNTVRDVFIFVEDDCRLEIERIEDGALAGEDDERARLGEILVDRGDLSPEELQQVLVSGKERLGEKLVREHLVEEGQVAAALAEQAALQEFRQSRKLEEGGSSVRVNSAKLDSLVDLIGELVTVQARLSRSASGHRDAELLSIAEEVERLTWELRDQVLNIRMLPIGTTFSKFRRLVRDLGEELGKTVELTTSGAETELDKTVIDRLNDPLVHLIRNCIDHGIEPPARRLALGKPEQGTIHLSASHAGANVLLRISDDGGGIDRQAVQARAVKMGLIAANAELSDKELMHCLFTPGLSTAREVTSVSGRGVGMDVVRQAIDGLRGSIEFSSEPGRGTVFTIKLPLTLAIIDGLLVSIGEDTYVLPLAAVEECIELTRQDVARARGRDLVNVRDEIVPYIRLREHFGVEGAPPAIEQVVISDVEGRRVGFAVDRVIGGHQTVIKSLGKFYRHVQGITGATILGDGRVALILDLRQLVHAAELDEKAAARQRREVKASA